MYLKVLNTCMYYPVDMTTSLSQSFTCRPEATKVYSAEKKQKV